MSSNMEQLSVAGALRLEGKTLASGWRVIRAVGWNPKTGVAKEIYNGTGGNFSRAYLVEKGGKKAFLKAIDLTRPLQEEDVMGALHRVTHEHNFETDILNLCSGANLDRVVVALDSGQEKLGEGFENFVPYLIFELADGDVRNKSKEVNPDLKLAWWLRAIHNAAVGLNQLHSRRITHLDLKPSNILSFGDAGGFKIGDLGSSVCEEKPGPFDNSVFSGDRTYAPPEILYNYIDRNAFNRRRCCDAYMLGSMIFFFGLGMGVTPYILKKMPLENWPFVSGGGWEGSYNGVLPLIRHNFSQSLEELRLALGSGKITEELIVCASQLCEPDPTQRGHPITRSGSGNDFALDRYVSIFDRLAKRASIESRKRIKR